MINLEKPDKCCDCGSYEHQIPMPINGRVRGIDFCLSDIVAALNAANIGTESSCCGHGREHGVISLSDERWLVITDRNGVKKIFEEYRT